MRPEGKRPIRTTNAIERLHEEFKRRIKTQTVLPSAETAAMLFWALLASAFVKAPLWAFLALWALWALIVVGQCFDVDFGFEQFFNVCHQTPIAARHQRNRQTRSPRPTRATNPMNVIFGVKRHIKVKHRRHIFDV